MELSPAKKIKLWTRQEKRSLEVLAETGAIRTTRAYLEEKFEEVAPYIIPLYEWFVEAAQIKLQKPKDVSFPIWCSISEENMMRPTVDTVVYVLEVDPSELIYFDGYKWDRVLNHLYIPIDDEDQKVYEAEMAAKGHKNIFSFMDADYGRFYPEEKQRVIDSWHRIFDITHFDIFRVQANIWEIKKEMIVDILYGDED